MNAKLAAVAFAAMIAAMSFPASAQSISYYQTGEEFAGPFPSWKSVKEFGAKGDGSTDDAAAIGKALKALKNTNAKTWNVLYFPAGTYMIGQPVYYTDRVNDDYTGLRIVGEDPATTLIKCMDTFPVATGGVAQGAMVRLDGTYGNICRISFDGNHRASIGLLRDGVYGTDWRITDMFFSNLATGIQYGGSSDQGQDLTAIMRCRFSRCGTGLKMTNQNCMGIYAWYCLFEDCRTAIDNGGGFAMPMCDVFLRSAVVDITTGQNGYPVLNNTSVGSKMFLDISQSPWCMVMANNNKVYNATDATVMKNVDVALDNTILSRSGPGPVFSSGKPNFVCIGNTFTIPNPVKGAARSCVLEQKIVDASTLAVPSAIRLPGTPRNNHRKIFEIQENAGDIAAEIQSKITAASLEPAGSNPVVHFPKGEYSLKSTIVIPANRDLQLVGDGGAAGASGVSISWSGSGSGPCFRLLGPTRVTISDISFALAGRGADMMTVEDADQPGGRIYCDQVETMGNTEGQEAACDWLIDGVENSDVTVVNQYIGLAARAVEVRGGRFLRSGGSTNGQVSFINGYLWGNQPNTLNVVDGGRLLFAGYRNENNPKGLMTLNSSSSGVVTFACNQEGVAKYPTPAFNIDGFRGALNVVAQASWLFEKRSSPVFRIRGDGGRVSVLSIGNMLAGGLDTSAAQTPIWDDQSSPPANAGSFLNDGLYWNPPFNRQSLPNIYRKASGAAIDAELVLKGLSHLRAMRLEPPMNRPAGATDLKFIRSFVKLSKDRYGLVIKSGDGKGKP